MLLSTRPLARLQRRPLSHTPLVGSSTLPPTNLSLTLFQVTRPRRLLLTAQRVKLVPLVMTMKTMSTFSALMTKSMRRPRRSSRNVLRHTRPRRLPRAQVQLPSPSSLWKLSHGMMKLIWRRCSLTSSPLKWTVSFGVVTNSSLSVSVSRSSRSTVLLRMPRSLLTTSRSKLRTLKTMSNLLTLLLCRSSKNFLL